MSEDPSHRSSWIHSLECSIHVALLKSCFSQFKISSSWETDFDWLSLSQLTFFGQSIMKRDTQGLAGPTGLLKPSCGYQGGFLEKGYHKPSTTLRGVCLPQLCLGIKGCLMESFSSISNLPSVFLCVLRFHLIFHQDKKLGADLNSFSLNPHI